MGLRDIARALLGISAYQVPSESIRTGLDIDDPAVHAVRSALGGQLQSIPVTTLRWYLDDLETAQYEADAGELALAARLYRAMRRDGVLAGLLGTRTCGLVRLPKRFYGEPSLCAELRTRNGSRSVFDDMCPPSELALQASDGIVLGVGIGELVPVPGRDFPILIRLDPEFLTYNWSLNRWRYASVAGLLDVTPGDGRWVLHCPGGRIAPWQSALWPALGRSFINKEQALLNRSNYVFKLANPARVAHAPIGANEELRKNFFERVMAWATDTVFSLPVGWDVTLLESKGEGIKVFQEVVDTSNHEMAVAIGGSTIPMDGGAGFQNNDIHKAIRSDLIQDTGDALAYTVNTQILPPWVAQRHGIEAIRNGPNVEWVTATPKDLNSQAASLVAASNAIKGLDEALLNHVGPTGRPIRIDPTEICIRFDIPILGEEVDGQTDEVAEARARATQPKISSRLEEDDEQREVIAAARARAVQPPRSSTKLGTKLR